MLDLMPWRRHEIEAPRKRPAAHLWSEIDDLFERFVGEKGGLGLATTKKFQPAFDFSETDSEFIIKAEVPGIDPHDVDISLSGDLLTIKGEKKEEKEESGDGFRRTERSFGSFSRTIRLPGEVREEGVKAEYKHGVLDLRLPKAESAKRRSVKIPIEGTA